MKKILLTLATTTLLFSCKKDADEVKGGTFASNKIGVHEGKSWSWIKVDKQGAPEQLALTIDDNALNSVPSANDEQSGGHNHENNIVIPIHPVGQKTTPFKFIFLNWNPAGHEPDGIYDLPHFDMHFYMTTEEEVMAATDMAKIENLPAPQYIPLLHVPGAAVPQMGKHWVDVTSPELNGAPFTQTFIYGSYNGNVTFYEPMITQQFLKNTTTFERPIPQPEKYQKAGFYPTKMKIKKHDGVTDIILDGFVQRQAS
jgi:hypothetical protein